MSENYLPAPSPDLSTWMYAIAQDGTHLQVCLMGDQAGNSPVAYLTPYEPYISVGPTQRMTTHVPLSSNYTTVPADSGKGLHNGPAPSSMTVTVNGNSLKPGHELSVLNVAAVSGGAPMGVSFSANDVVHDGRTGTTYPAGTTKGFTAGRLAAGAKITFKLREQSGGVSHWHVTSHVAGPNGGFDYSGA